MRSVRHDTLLFVLILISLALSARAVWVATDTLVLVQDVASRLHGLGLGP